MRIAVIFIAALSIAGCGRPVPADEQGSRGHGRYAGIGVFEPGELWSRIAVKPPNRPAAASTDDDEHIIVVVDSISGEVRQCGDHSGYCIAMNPWAQAVTSAQRLPVDLTKHEAQLRAERQEIEIQADVKAKAVPKKRSPAEKDDATPQPPAT